MPRTMNLSEMIIPEDKPVGFDVDAAAAILEDAHNPDQSTTLSIDQFRKCFHPWLSRQFLDECKNDGRLKGFYVGRNFRIAPSELENFLPRLLMGIPVRSDDNE